MATKMSFAEQIKHPNWQRKRLEVLSDAGFECENCGAKDVTLNVHHKQYVKGRMYWQYERHELECLCEICHKAHHLAQDGLRQLLAEVDTHQAFALIAGFHHASDWIDRDNARRSRDIDALTYAAGLVAWITADLEIDEMLKVAEFAASLHRPNAEAGFVLQDAGSIFGKAD
jgi:hypothetical protein